MSTKRACATVGLGLSLVLGLGCSSSSKSGSTDGGTRDTRRADGPQNNFNPDTTQAQTCTTVDGTKVQPGRTIVINCVTWTCVSGTNFTGSGTPCADGGRAADAPVNRDTVAPADARPSETGVASDGGGGKDTQPGEAGPGKVDASGEDARVPDAVVQLDLATVTPEDTAQPTPDLPALVQCTSGGVTYNAGDTFACGCNSCFCDSAGATRQLTNYVPGDTFLCDLNCNTCLCNSSNAVQHLTNNVCTVDAAN
jgi:hypothetical protein